MWSTAISGIISLLTGGISNWFQQKKVESDAKLELAKSNLELIKQQGVDAVESEKNKLAATGQWFKFISYVLLNYPIIITVWNPSSGKEIFNSIGIIPQWYAMLYVAVVGVIWGLPIASNWMSSVFSNIQDAWSLRQDKKIEKIKAVNETKLFASLRKTIFKQGLTQEQVGAIQEALKESIE